MLLVKAGLTRSVRFVLGGVVPIDSVSGVVSIYSVGYTVVMWPYVINRIGYSNSIVWMEFILENGVGSFSSTDFMNESYVGFSVKTLFTAFLGLLEPY